MSEFSFHCPHCGQLLTAMDDLVGEQVDCPNALCARELTVPSRDEADTPPLKSSKGGFGSSFGSGSGGASAGGGAGSGSLSSLGSPSGPRSFSKRKPGEPASPPPVPPEPPPVPGAGGASPADDTYELAADAPASPPPPPLPSQLGPSAEADDWGTDDAGDGAPRASGGSAVPGDYKSPAYNDAYAYGDMPAKTEMLAQLSLGLGIGSVAILFVCCCFMPLTLFASVPLGLGGVGCGIVGLRRIRESNGQLTGQPLATAGIVCGSVGLVLCLGYVVMLILQVALALSSN